MICDLVVWGVLEFCVWFMIWCSFAKVVLDFVFGVGLLFL